MSSAIMPFTLPEHEKPVAARLADLIAHGRPMFVLDENDQPVEVSGAIRDNVAKLMADAGSDDLLFVVRPNDEVSPEQAASLLGMSRPSVYKQMDIGNLPFRSVGTHRRLAMSDVLRYKAKRDATTAAMTEMYEFFDGLEQNKPR